MSQKATFERVDNDQDFVSEERNSDVNGAEQIEVIPGVQVKFEPEDLDYDSTLGGGDVPMELASASTVERSSPALGSKWSSPSAVRSQMRKIMENKSVDSSTAAQNVQIVIEDLLKKNEYLLSQNVALGYKPHSRRGRIPGEVGRSKEVIFPAVGQSTTFSVGHQTQGRVVVANNRSSLPQGETTTTVPMGQLMRPKSPTRRCGIPDKDKSHFNLAFMESKVGSDESEQIFHVQKHEMVCAISSQTKVLNKEGHLVSSLDINYYWCNFCCYSTTSKSQLMQHVVEHRFHCKYCRYQSFSRADVIHHSVHTHPEFQESAATTQYCTLLSDYLRIHNPIEIKLDQQRKRKMGPHNDDDDDNEYKGDDDDDDDNIGQAVNKTSKGDQKKSKQKRQKSQSQEYDLYDLNLESTEENATDERSATSSQELGSRSTSASSSLANMASLYMDQAASRPASVGSPATQARGSPVPEIGQPVITQVFSVATVPPVLAPELPPPASQANSIQHQGTSSGRNAASGGASPSPVSNSSPMNPNSIGAGAMQQMRSNLYWSCGYCPFKSSTQSGIKEHSVKEHWGKPHRYVALIKSDDRSTPPPSKSGSGDDSSSSMDQNADTNNAGEETAFSSDGQVATGNHQEDPPVLVKEEPVESDDSTTSPSSLVPIKVRFPAPRVVTKDNTSIKCYHCNYSARILGPLRNHILRRHKGSSLVGLGGMNSKVFMCTRADCTFRSSSGQTFLTHAKECTPWTETTQQEDAHLVDSLKATIQLAEESQTASSSTQAPSSSSSEARSKVRNGMFSCIYCKFHNMSSKELAKQHVLQCHGAQCLIVKNVHAHRKRKRSSVFFCRWCPWEGDQREDHDLHAMYCRARCQAGALTQDNNTDDSVRSRPSSSAVKGEASNSTCPLDAGDDSDSMEPPDITADVHAESDSAHGTITTTPYCMPINNTAAGSGPVSSRVSADDQRGSDIDSDGIPMLNRISCDDLGACATGDSPPPLLGLPVNCAVASRENCSESAQQVRKVANAFRDKHRNALHARPKWTLKVKGKMRVQQKTNCPSRTNSWKWKLYESKKVTDVQCYKCNHIFDSLSSLKIHVRDVHKLKTSCHFKSVYHRQLHLKCTFFACPSPDCSLYRYNEADVVQHYIKSHSSQPHPYLKPSYKPQPVDFSQKRALESRCNNNSRPKVPVKKAKPFLCLYCDQYFYTDSIVLMKSHYVAVHPDQAMIIRDVNAHKNKQASRLCVCEQVLCDFTTFKAAEMDMHTASQHPKGSEPGARSFQCVTCGWVTLKDSSVRSHVQQKHANEGGTSIVIINNVDGQSTMEEKVIFT